MSDDKLKTANFGNRHTPCQVLIDALHEAEDAKACIVVLLDKDDYIRTGWSDAWTTTRVGLLEFAKQRIIALASEE